MRLYCTHRECQCAHTVLEAALTGDEAEYVRYVALRNQIDFDLLRSMLQQLKHALVSKLPGLPWFDANTVRETQRRLRELKVCLLESDGRVNLTGVSTCAWLHMMAVLRVIEVH